MVLRTAVYFKLILLNDKKNIIEQEPFYITCLAQILAS